MKTTKTFLFILLTLLIASCDDNSTSSEKTVSLNGQTYANGVLGFKISAPGDWQLQQNANVADMKALLIGSKLNYTGMAPTFNIISGNAQGMKTSQEMLDASRLYISSHFSDVIFESSRTFNEGGFDCGELVYSFNYNGINLKQRQVLFLCSSKTSIAITFTAEKLNFNNATDDFDFIINSLRML